MSRVCCFASREHTYLRMYIHMYIMYARMYIHMYIVYVRMCIRTYMRCLSLMLMSLEHQTILCTMMWCSVTHILYTYVHPFHSSTVLLPILSNPVDPLSLLPSSPSSPFFSLLLLCRVARPRWLSPLYVRCPSPQPLDHPQAPLRGNR